MCGKLLLFLPFFPPPSDLLFCFPLLFLFLPLSLPLLFTSFSIYLSPLLSSSLFFPYSYFPSATSKYILLPPFHYSFSYLSLPFLFRFLSPFPFLIPYSRLLLLSISFPIPFCFFSPFPFTTSIPVFFPFPFNHSLSVRAGQTKKPSHPPAPTTQRLLARARRAA